MIVGPNGGTANVFPLKTGVGSTHQVYGVDAQHIPQWRGRFPLTDIAFFDDGFFVTLETDFQVHGSYGGPGGLTLPAGTQLVCGDYRMFNAAGDLLETFRYKSNIPVASLPVGGNAEAAEGAFFVAIACDIESALFGSGDVRALGEIRPLGDGLTYLDFRYVMHFPSQLAGSTVTQPHVSGLPPLP